MLSTKPNFKRLIDKSLKSFNKLIKELEEVNANIAVEKDKEEKEIAKKQALVLSYDAMTESNIKILTNVKGIFNVNNQPTTEEVDSSDSEAG